MAEIITYNNMTSEYTRTYDDKQNATTEAQKNFENVVKNSSDNKVVLGQIELYVNLVPEKYSLASELPKTCLI